MATIKTAISIQKGLFDQVEIMAQKLHVSRSHLFVIAVEDFIQRNQNQALLDEINQAYAEGPDPAELTRLSQTRKLHRSLVEGEW